MLHIEMFFFFLRQKTKHQNYLNLAKLFVTLSVVSLWYWGYDTLSEGCIKPLGKTAQLLDTADILD